MAREIAAKFCLNVVLSQMKVSFGNTFSFGYDNDDYGDDDSEE